MMAGLLTSIAGVSCGMGLTTGTGGGRASRSTRKRFSEYVGPVASIVISSV